MSIVGVNPDLLTLGRTTSIHAVDFDIPLKSEELLELRYGANRRTPMTPYLLDYSWQR